jgi:hypothetical protein
VGIQVLTFPAPNVEPVERPPEIPLLLSRNLYLLALRLRSQFLEIRVSRLQVRVGQATLFERYLVGWAEVSPDTDAKPLSRRIVWIESLWARLLTEDRCSYDERQSQEV